MSPDNYLDRWGVALSGTVCARPGVADQEEGCCVHPWELGFCPSTCHPATARFQQSLTPSGSSKVAEGYFLLHFHAHLTTYSVRQGRYFATPCGKASTSPRPPHASRQQVREFLCLLIPKCSKGAFGVRLDQPHPPCACKGGRNTPPQHRPP